MVTAFADITLRKLKSRRRIMICNVICVKCVIQIDSMYQSFLSIFFHFGHTHAFVFVNTLTHWSRVTHICVSKLTNIGSDNDLPPGRRQAIIWANAGILLIWHVETNFSEILIEIHIFLFKKMHLKISSRLRNVVRFVLASMYKGLGRWPPFICHFQLRFVPTIVDTPELVLVMTWSHQATSHYLNQCFNAHPDRADDVFHNALWSRDWR